MSYYKFKDKEDINFIEKNKIKIYEDNYIKINNEIYKINYGFFDRWTKKEGYDYSGLDINNLFGYIINFLLDSNKIPQNLLKINIFSDWLEDIKGKFIQKNIERLDKYINDVDIKNPDSLFYHGIRCALYTVCRDRPDINYENIGNIKYIDEYIISKFGNIYDIDKKPLFNRNIFFEFGQFISISYLIDNNILDISTDPKLLNDNDNFKIKLYLIYKLENFVIPEDDKKDYINKLNKIFDPTGKILEDILSKKTYNPTIKLEFDPLKIKGFYFPKNLVNIQDMSKIYYLAIEDIFKGDYKNSKDDFYNFGKLIGIFNKFLSEKYNVTNEEKKFYINYNEIQNYYSLLYLNRNIISENNSNNGIRLEYEKIMKRDKNDSYDFQDILCPGEVRIENTSSNNLIDYMNNFQEILLFNDYKLYITEVYDNYKLFEKYRYFLRNVIPPEGLVINNDIIYIVIINLCSLQFPPPTNNITDEENDVLFIGKDCDPPPIKEIEDIVKSKVPKPLSLIRGQSLQEVIEESERPELPENEDEDPEIALVETEFDVIDGKNISLDEKLIEKSIFLKKNNFTGEKFNNFLRKLKSDLNNSDCYKFGFYIILTVFMNYGIFKDYKDIFDKGLYTVDPKGEDYKKLAQEQILNKGAFRSKSIEERLFYKELFYSYGVYVNFYNKTIVNNYKYNNVLLNYYKG